VAQYSGVMSGGKPVFVVVMYWLKARIRWGSVHNVESRPREQTSFTRRFQSRAQAGQGRMGCWKVSCSTPQRGQDRSGF